MMSYEDIDYLNISCRDQLFYICKSLFGSVKSSKFSFKRISNFGFFIRINEDDKFLSFLTKPKIDGFELEDCVNEIYDFIQKDRSNLILYETICFIDSCKSVSISSVKNDHCLISYAPFVRVCDKVYICISSIAKHYHAMRQNPNNLSLMFIEDEASSRNIFARVRVGFDAEAKFLCEVDNCNIYELFKAKFINEEVINRLKNLDDFFIVELKISNGFYVKDFGEAYRLKEIL